MARLFGIVALLALTPVGCRSEPHPGEIVVSAAISLKGPMEEIVALYHERFPDFQVRLNLAASGLLGSQIARGAPVDVFASASMHFLDKLEHRKLLMTGSRRLLAGNRLVLITPGRSRLEFRDWSSLASVGRIALGNPSTVPAGAYAEQCLRSLGLWEKLLPRLIFAEHARQVLDWAANDEVDAALVYATDAAILPGAVRVVATAPEGAHPPIRYGIAVVATSQRPDASRSFVELATGMEGLEALESHGFSLLKP